MTCSPCENGKEEEKEVCVVGGGAGTERNGHCNMSISCQRGVKCVCQGSGGWTNAEIIASERHERGGSRSVWWSRGQPGPAHTWTGWQSKETGAAE